MTNKRRLITIILTMLGVIGFGVGSAAWYLHDVWQNLPTVEALDHYQPALPLRIYANDGSLLAEYGEERREVVALAHIPLLVRHSLLAIEDTNFYKHGPVDYPGLLRALCINLLTRQHAQGGSTITMQVARRFFLSTEKTYYRKLREILLAYKLEQTYSKDKILELYMNQIYLGERAYGFAAAANIYFGKTLGELSAAEAAMLAGLPKAPSAYNPVANPVRAKIRQQYILLRMRELGYLDPAQYEGARTEALQLKPAHLAVLSEFAYPVERARQLVLAQYGEASYRMGLDVMTTINVGAQHQAYQALRQGLLRTQMRNPYSAEAHVKVDPVHPELALTSYPNREGLEAAVVTRAGSQGFTAVTRDGTALQLRSPARVARPLTVGAVVRVQQLDGRWQIVQSPEMEGALISMDVMSGDIMALVGGFDFDRNKFDHALQAYRQPGSCFKPFVYSAALEKGYFPGTLVDDSQRLIDAEETGAQPWRPRNYGNRYDGFITARQGLIRSKNLVAVGLMQAAGAEYVQQFATRFGFEANRNPASLPLALGAGASTPLQLAQAFAVFANGGNLVQPRLIQRILLRNGEVSYQPEKAPEPRQVISARNAYIMDSMLRDVVQHGTARGAAVIEKPDVAGKTGTSNNANDAWFAGYSTGLATSVWIGYDQTRSLGAATGATLALPIWTQFMRAAVVGRTPVQHSLPADLETADGDFVYPEYLSGRCLSDDHAFIRTPWKCRASATHAIPPAVANDERDRILQWFRQGD